MKLGTIVETCFAISFFISLVGAYLKITHSQGAEILLIIAVIATLIFLVSAIYEVRTSKRIDHAQKTMGVIAFILMSGVTGLIYFLIGRRRIADNS